MIKKIRASIALAFTVLLLFSTIGQVSTFVPEVEAASLPDLQWVPGTIRFEDSERNQITIPKAGEPFFICKDIRLVADSYVWLRVGGFWDINNAYGDNIERGIFGAAIDTREDLPLCGHVNALEQSGTYEVVFTLDPDNEVVEADETNNVYIGEFILSEALSKTSKLPASTLSVKTGKRSYTTGEIIRVTGTVPTIIQGENVWINVFNPNGDLYTIGEATPKADRTYAFEFKISGKLGISGTYIVRAIYPYPEQDVETTFEFEKAEKPPDIFLDKEIYNANERGVITVISPNDNLDPNRIESIQVRLRSSTDPTGLLLTLKETGSNTGIFETMFSLVTDRSSSGTTLRVSPGDTIMVKYGGISAGASIKTKTAPLGNVFDVKASLSNGQINKIGIDQDFTSVVISVSTSATDDGEMTITLPRQLIDARADGKDGQLIILVDGEEYVVDQTKTTSTERTLTIPTPAGTKEIEIIGTKIGSGTVIVKEPEVEETTEAPTTAEKPETGQIAERPTISKGKKYTSPLAITADLSNLYVGKYATYDFNYLLQLPNEPEVFQMGKIEYRVNSYDSITREYTITTTSKLSSSNEVSSSDTETRTTDSSNPFEVENIMHLIDATFPGSSDINVEQTGSGVGKIRNQSYQTNDYKYLITKEQVLGRQSKPDGTAIEPILEIKINGELKVLKESGIPHTLSFKLEDAYLTGIEDEDTREEVLMDFDSFIKSMKETSFSLSMVLVDTDIELGIPPAESTGGGGCLIATAAFGSELTPQVQFLRSFRDNHILSTAAGSSFMNVFNMWYYSFSPSVADAEREIPVLQQTIKYAIYPLLGILTVAEKTYSLFNGEAGAISAGFVASSMIGFVYFSPIAYAITKVRRFSTNVFIYAAFVSLAGVVAGILISDPILLMITTSAFVLTVVGISAVLSSKLISKIIRK